MNPEASLRYWMTAISVNVQINIANAILSRVININSSRLNKLYHNDSCPDHILVSNSINGTQLTGSQHINDDYNDMHYEYDNDSEEDLFVPTPPLILIRLIPILKTQITPIPCHYHLLNYLHLLITYLFIVILLNYHPLQLLFYLHLQPYHLNNTTLILNDHLLTFILNDLDIILPHLNLPLSSEYIQKD